MPPVSTTPADRGAQRRERTREAALVAAEQLLGERTPAEIRIEDVAALAGLSPGSIYGHFKTKDGLIAATTDRLLSQAAEALRVASATGATPLERFQNSGVAYLRLLLDHPAVIKYLALTGERAPETDEERDAHARIIQLRVDFEAVIRDAVQAGGVRHVDPRLMSYFLFGAWNGVAALALRRDGLGLSRAEIEAAVLQAGLMLTGGVAGPPA